MRPMQLPISSIGTKRPEAIALPAAHTCGYETLCLKLLNGQL